MKNWKGETIMNLNNLMKLYDNELFDGIVLPQGIDFQLVVNSILQKCALDTPLYPEFTLFHDMILHFFEVKYDIYKRLYDTFNLQYNVIENYDKKEDITINYTSEGNANALTKVSAFDSTSLSDRDKTETDDTRKDTTITTNRTHGNIGVTTSTQMIENEVKLRQQLDIYEIIANDFYTTFMLFC